MGQGYECPRCQYKTRIAVDMKRHLTRKTPCPPIYSETEPAAVIDALFPSSVTKTKSFTCKHCSKCFSSSQSRSNHYRDVHGQSRGSLNTGQIASALVDLQKKVNELEKMQSNTTTNTIQNNTINSNNNVVTQNIVINAFGHENTQHITKQFIDQCVRRTNKGIVELIEKIHFDPDMEENCNLSATNIKVPLIRVHDGSSWTYGRKDRVLGQLVDKGHGIMQEHFDDNEDTIRDSVSDSMFNHIRKWLDKMQEKDKKTWEDVLTDMYILIINATEKGSLRTR